MQSAPLFNDDALGPLGGAAFWLTTADNVRIRVVFWPAEAAKGTVLILTGRTEYAEKYGRTAAEMTARGYACLAIDWRGQGLSERPLANPLIGHVDRFTDYQHDFAAVLDYATSAALPEPFYMLGHSMGGCIGLRALMDGFKPQAAVFSAPKWGVKIAPFVRVYAWFLTTSSVALGLDKRMIPGQSEDFYVLREAFEDNTLTNDRENWAFLGGLITKHPELGIGGPSMRWLYESLWEMRALYKRPSPAIPCMTFLGTDESTVEPKRIHDRMSRWDNGTLELVQGGKHEMLTDKPAMRNAILDKMTAFFDAH